MLKFIEKLRDKSESDREKILAVFVFVFMLIVIFLWATNLDAIFPSASVDENNAKVSDVSPFKIFSESISSFKETISNEINLIKN